MHREQETEDAIKNIMSSFACIHTILSSMYNAIKLSLI